MRTTAPSLARTLFTGIATCLLAVACGGGSPQGTRGPEGGVARKLDANSSSAAGAAAPAQVAPGYYHTAALRSDGTVWTWGNNGNGQLGDGTTAPRSSPGQVPGLNKVGALAAGYNYTLALASDGTVWSWGANDAGQLGDGTTIDRSVPARIPGLFGVAALAAGFNFAVALKTDGTVWAWGFNAYGQLGDGSTTNRHTPVQVAGVFGVTAIATGFNFVVALAGNGQVSTWGYNGNGQLGDGTTTVRSGPVQVASLAGVSAIAARSDHAIALKSDGTVWAWGTNYYGKLGDGTTNDSALPVQVSGLSAITTIVAGSYHNVALRSDGAGFSWGANYDGQLGVGSAAYSITPLRIPQLDGAHQVKAGHTYTVTLAADGTLASWGNNSQFFAPFVAGPSVPPPDQVWNGNLSALIASFGVTASSGAGGLVLPAASLQVAQGTQLQLSISTVQGYHLVAVSGCGGSRIGAFYTTAPVHADCAVAARFGRSDVTFRAPAYLAANPDVAAALRDGRLDSAWQHYANSGWREGRLLEPPGYAGFSEAAYLAANPDVLAALRAGQLTSGWQHYLSSGRTEGRLLEPAGYGAFSEEAYLAANPDVADALKRGLHGIKSGWDHYVRSGKSEGRALSPRGYGSFSEDAYLAANPDVAAALSAGRYGITSGWDHYARGGKAEGRLVHPGGYVMFNEARYLAANPDVQAAVRAGQFTSGREHYEIFGRPAGLALEPAGYGAFDEAAYLAANPDVRDAVRAGHFSSGWQYFATAGSAENRPHNPIHYGAFSEADYLAANPDVHQMLVTGAGGISSGWDHYDRFGRAQGRRLRPSAVETIAPPGVNQAPLPAIDYTLFSSCPSAACSSDLIQTFGLDQLPSSAQRVVTESVLTTLDVAHGLSSTPASVLGVYNPLTDTTFRAGIDYLVSNGQIVFLSSGLIPPTAADYVYTPDPDSPYLSVSQSTTPGKLLRIADDFHQHQVRVSYVSNEQRSPVRLPKPLPRFFERLKSGQPVAITWYGDSITQGGGASLLVAPPRQPGFTELVGALLTRDFPGQVYWRNRSVGNWSTVDSTPALQGRINDTQQDLVVIAFGMNDALLKLPAADFRANLDAMIRNVRAASASTEILLLSGMMANLEWQRFDGALFASYRDAMTQMMNTHEGVSVADVTSAFDEMLTRKRFADVTSNGVNHPNDFGHLVYAQTLYQMLSPH